MPDLDAIAAHLTSDRAVRGGEVESAADFLDALQVRVPWTVGSDSFRPTPEDKWRKHVDRMDVLMQYKQRAYYPGEGGAPRLAQSIAGGGGDAAPAPLIDMYDYLCANLYDLPTVPAHPPPDGFPTFMRPGRDGEAAPCEEVTPDTWLEVDWAAVDRDGFTRVKFTPNTYPYQLPPVVYDPAARGYMRCGDVDGDGVAGGGDAMRATGPHRAAHSLLWFLHFPDESPSKFEGTSSAVVDALVRDHIARTIGGGAPAFDYIWYRNPKMTVPDLFHVQVFWISRPAGAGATA